MLLPLAACATDELALAPSTPDRPWVIPPTGAALPRPGTVPPRATSSEAAAPQAADSSTRPDAASGEIARGNEVSIDPGRHYDLAELIDLAQRNNPQTREAWERARQAALAVGLVEASYVPQISAEIIGGFQHTPLPIPPSADSRRLFHRQYGRADPGRDGEMAAV